MDVFIPQPSPIGGEPSPSLCRLIDEITEGYPFVALDRLVRDLDLTQREAADLVGIRGGTLARRRGARLSPAESSRVYELRRLLEQAERAIGHAGDARRWLKESIPNLGDASLTLACTTPDLEAVERYLDRIAEGVAL